MIRENNLAQASESVAIYWAFEDLYANLVDQPHGQGAYLANRFRPQDEVIDVETIVEYALSLGPIAINRAFANWVSFNRWQSPAAYVSWDDEGLETDKALRPEWRPFVEREAVHV